jgi:hypothetical protein
MFPRLSQSQNSWHEFRFTEWEKEEESIASTSRRNPMKKVYSVLLLVLLLIAGALGGIAGTAMADRWPLSTSNLIAGAMCGAFCGLSTGIAFVFAIVHFVPSATDKWVVGVVGVTAAAGLFAAILVYYLSELIASC